MEFSTEVETKSVNTTDSVDDLALKADERFLHEIENAFKEIVGNSAVGKILCNEQR